MPMVLGLMYVCHSMKECGLTLVTRYLHGTCTVVMHPTCGMLCKLQTVSESPTSVSTVDFNHNVIMNASLQSYMYNWPPCIEYMYMYKDTPFPK